MTEFYLKILSGNHIGAEIPLEPGRYSLGKGDSCDLVLTDENLSDHELIIVINDDGQVAIQSTSSDSLLYLNGEPAGSNIQYNYFDIVTSNHLFIALGPVDADWPSLALPNVAPATNLLAEDEVSPEDTSELLPPNFAEELPKAKSIDEDEEDDELEEGSFFDKISDKVNKKWLIATPVAIVLFIVMVNWLSSGSDETVPDITPAPDNFLFTTQAKKELGLSGLQLKELPDQTIHISGYTQTLQDKLDLQKLLRQQGIPFNSQIVVMNEMRDNAELLLKDRGYDLLELELDNTFGSLVLTGYVATSDELDQIINTLKQEIYGLVSVVDQVENQAGRINTLKSMLREKGLIPRVTVIVREETALLKGHLLDEGQIYDLQNVVNKFQKKYANNPALEIATKYPGGPITDSQLPFSLDIRGISMGKVPYVILLDGSKYLIGAKFSNGYIIEDINLDYLLLTNGTDRIKYRLGGNRGGNKTK